ncbi:TatD family deoxyribonuclease [Priestia megaterium]|nr:TatD family deoxyribonuclease [Priestia megaterium]
MNKIIDAHIHLDQYKKQDLLQIIENDSSLKGLVAVSWDLNSCKINQEMAARHPKVHPAYGYHPEQLLPSDHELADLLSWMALHTDEMVAVGEVGLPYYFYRQQTIPVDPYIELLELMILKAKQWDKPLVLHAIYEHAQIVCDLLEKHSVSKAHFHWFKGDQTTVERMIQNNYYISFTPDVVYEKEIQTLVKAYPVQQIMVETDGPWSFKGPFQGKQTHPSMIHQSIEMIASLKHLPSSEVYAALYKNTVNFYNLKTN